MKTETKQKVKAILKRTGKALILVVIVSAIAAAAAFGLSACNPKTNNTGNVTPTPVPSFTVQQAWQANQANVNAFVAPIIKEVKGNTAESKILYTAYDLGDKDQGSIDDVTVYMTKKGDGNERIYTVSKATFDAVEAANLRDGKGTLTNLVLENLETILYDETTFEQHADIYSASHDKVVKAFEGNEFEQQTPEYVPTITSTQTLVSEYPAAVDALSNRISAAIMNKYEYNQNDVVFCGCKLPNADSKGMIDSMTIRVARKTGDSERTVSDYRVVFDPVYLDKIADGTATYTNVRSAFEDSFTYDAKTADPAAIAEYFEDYDSDYVIYEVEHFEDPVIDVTIDQVINNYGDTVNANLEGHYDAALRRVFAGRYDARKDQVTSYQWDLGNVVDGKIQNAKLTFLWENNNSATMYVCDVDFASPISLNDLTDNAKISAATASYTPAYSFVYDTSIQGTRDELAAAILQNAGIDPSTVDYIIKDNGTGTTSELGTVKSFVVSVCDGASIVEISVDIQTASTDAGLIAKLQAGKAVTSSTQKATFSQNMLELVNLEAEAEL